MSEEPTTGNVTVIRRGGIGCGTILLVAFVGSCVWQEQSKRNHEYRMDEIQAQRKPISGKCQGTASDGTVIILDNCTPAP